MNTSDRSHRASDEGGQVVVLLVISLLVVMGMIALVIDLGYLYWNQRVLQSSADAAALAGAMELPDAGKAEAAARSYGTAPGSKNHDNRLVSVTESVTTKCVISIPGCNPVNSVSVAEEGHFDTFFMRLFGLSTVTVKARANAIRDGGEPKPAHIMIIFDRTGSMNDPCTAGGSKVTCARNGINSFLTGMDPAYDKIGLIAFPPGDGGSDPCTFTPKGTDGPTTDYDAHPNGYVLVPLSTDYKTSATSPLNAGSPLVKTNACIRANGTTATAAAIDKAHTTLAASHDPDAQDVIIFFTDGEANYGPCTDNNNDQICENNASPYRSTPCQQAVNSAAVATAAGTWVYGIAYDTAGVQCWGWKSSGNDASGKPCAKKNGFQFRCTEQPAITADSAVRQIASDPTRFFLLPNPGDLTAIFKRIAADLTGTRLVNDGLIG